MALDQAANFVRETVTSAISAGDTTINVADATPFPVPPEGYNIVVWDGAAYVRPDQDPDVEIMRVTDTDTTNDTLTVARGQEGTSDFNHPDTSVVVVAQTAKMIADIASEKISNPVTENVNVDGNDVTNVGALDVDEVTIAQAASRVSLGTDQTLSSGATTTVDFDTVRFDDLNGFNSGVFTAPRDGTMLVRAAIRVSDPGTESDRLNLLLKADGNIFSEVQHRAAGGGNFQSFPIFATRNVSAGEDIELDVFTDPEITIQGDQNRSFIEFVLL